MGVGGSNSKTSSGTETSPFAPLIAKFAKSFLPAAKTFGAQETEALKTGGVGAQIPIINRAVDASRGAESSANQETQQALARAGLANTSFGASILGNQNMAGRQATAAIPTNIASQFISAVPGTASTGVGAASAAASANRSMTSTPSFWDSLQQGLKTGLDPGGVFGSKGASSAGSAFGGSSGGTAAASSAPELETLAV